jgi:hypothetical protein
VLNYAPRHKDVLGEWKCSSIHSLTSALDEGEWSASRPGRKSPHYHWIGGRVSPRAGLDTVSKRTNSQPPPGIELQSSDRPVRSQSLHRLSYLGSSSSRVQEQNTQISSPHLREMQKATVKIEYQIDTNLLF